MPLCRASFRCHFHLCHFRCHFRFFISRADFRHAAMMFADTVLLHDFRRYVARCHYAMSAHCFATLTARATSYTIMAPEWYCFRCWYRQHRIRILLLMRHIDDDWFTRLITNWTCRRVFFSSFFRLRCLRCYVQTTIVNIFNIKMRLAYYERRLYMRK